MLILQGIRICRESGFALLSSVKSLFTMVDYQAIIDRILEESRRYLGQGRVADYIPALAEVDPHHMGISVSLLDGRSFAAGDTDIPFSIQSISKVFTLSMVTAKIGEELWKSVGREPSGNPFNSLVQLEHERGIPRNPFINAGALVVTDRLISLYHRPKEAILDFVRSMAGNNDIYYDSRVAVSERENADRNMALAYFMKSFGNIRNDVEMLIDVYCHQCAIAMSCGDISQSFLMLADRGINPHTGTRILTESQSKRLGAVMSMCGFYDESGDFAYRVGLPGKSGVGGGIAAYMPGKLAISVWSPELNSYGNSLAGIEILERFTTDIRRSIF